MNKNRKKALIFDLDGTLVDTLASLAISGNAMLESFGIPARPKEEYKYHSGNGSRTLVERTLKAAGREEGNPSVEEGYQRYLECFARHCCDEVRPFDGLPELLREWQKAGLLLVVLTNKLQTMADRVMAAAYPEQSFDGIFGQRPGIPLKPDPKAANPILAAFDLSPEEVLYFGDTDIDMMMAENCGFTSVAMTWGSRTEAELRKTSAGHIARTADELRQIVASYLG